MIDGQDNKHFGGAGSTIPLNNPDLIQEVRLGRTSSALSMAQRERGLQRDQRAVGRIKSWLGLLVSQRQRVECLQQRQKAGANGFCNPTQPPIPSQSPVRVENQLGGTIGGPLHLPRFGEGGPSIINGKDRTFFFFSIQRWWDRQLGIGQALNGAPTAEGKEIIRQAAGDLPQVRALLDFLPAAGTPLNQTVSFVRNGQTFVVRLARDRSQSSTYDDWQTSIRIDHRFGDKHSLTAVTCIRSRCVRQYSGVAASQNTPPDSRQSCPRARKG